VAGEWLASPSGGGGPPLEADLVMAGGAAIVVRVALGVSSWNGGRRPWGGVLDPWVAERLRSACGAPWWTSIWSGSTTAWFSSAAGAVRGAGGGGPFGAVSVPGRVRFPAVGASGWGGKAASEDGVKVSPARA